MNRICALNRRSQRIVLAMLCGVLLFTNCQNVSYLPATTPSGVPAFALITPELYPQIVRGSELITAGTRDTDKLMRAQKYYLAEGDSIGFRWEDFRVQSEGGCSLCQDPDRCLFQPSSMGRFSPTVVLVKFPFVDGATSDTGEGATFARSASGCANHSNSCPNCPTYIPSQAGSFRLFVKGLESPPPPAENTPIESFKNEAYVSPVFGDDKKLVTLNADFIRRGDSRTVNYPLKLIPMMDQEQKVHWVTWIRGDQPDDSNTPDTSWTENFSPRLTISKVNVFTSEGSVPFSRVLISTTPVCKTGRSGCLTTNNVCEQTSPGEVLLAACAGVTNTVTPTSLKASGRVRVYWIVQFDSDPGKPVDADMRIQFTLEVEP